MKKILLALFLFIFCLSIQTNAQRQVIGKGDAFIFGADTLPSNNNQTDTLFYYNHLNSNIYSGVIGGIGSNFPQLDSFGFGSAGFGIEVIPLGLASFSMGLYNTTQATASSTLGYGLRNFSPTGMAIGIQNDTKLSQTGLNITNNTPLFMIGNGNLNALPNDNDFYHNALTVYYDGRVEVNDAYTLPTVDGQLSQVLGTNGNGNLTWQDAAGVFEKQGTLIRPADDVNSDFIIGADAFPGSDSITETLFFFDDSKGAFRAGALDYSDAWKSTNIGSWSIGLGYNAKASNSWASAMGRDATASGWGSLALGSFTKATDFYATAIGYATEATGNTSTAIGRATKATGDYSTSLGFNTNAKGDLSFAIGTYCTSNAYASTALGQYNMGAGNMTEWVSTDPIFEIGIGESFAGRTNAMTVLKNGNVGIGTHMPVEKLEIEGRAKLTTNSSISTPTLNLIEDGNDYSRLTFANKNINTANFWTVAGRVNAIDADSRLNFYYQNSGDVLQLFGDGRVFLPYRIGIGDSTPDAALDINSEATGEDPLHVQVGSVDKMRVYQNGSISLGGLVSGTPDDVFIVNQLGMGVTSPSYRIDIQNSTTASLGKARANEWLSLSDARIKKNVESIDYGLKEILQLHPVKYNHHSSEFKESELVVMDEHSPEIGFLAQEVYQVIEEIVEKPIDESQDLWSMNYEKLTPVLVKAIQELNSEKIDMQHQLNAQQKMIDQLLQITETLTSQLSSLHSAVNSQQSAVRSPQ